MKLINQTWEWISIPQMPLETIERAGRVCYKSEEKISLGSAEKFVGMIIKRGHESVIEHASASMRFITNRGVTHELVRHRLCSFSQESTRYVRYDKDDIEFIRPVWWNEMDSNTQKLWCNSLEQAEKAYLEALEHGLKPEQARELLPHALKTDIVVTANLRQWRHTFKLRCVKVAHPQIRTLMIDCLKGFAKEIPIIFDDLVEKYATN